MIDPGTSVDLSVEGPVDDRDGFMASRLRIVEEDEDRPLSNKRVEAYVLCRAEEVTSLDAAWIATGKGKAKPRGLYIKNIHASPAFQERLKTLMDEKAELETKGVWGTLEWQAKQNYRRAAALGDLSKMMEATRDLLKIVLKGAPIPDEKPKRPVGAPLVEVPMSEGTDEDGPLRRRFLDR